MPDEFATKKDLQALSQRLTKFVGQVNQVGAKMRAQVDKADNKQTSKVAKEYLTKKELGEIEKLMDAMEKRHAELVKKQTANYAKKFKSLVGKEFAKAGR